MSKIGDVAFCVDCDLARSTQLKIAVGDSSGAAQELPRRMATKKDASGDALCTACLDARVQRRRAEFLKPRAPSASPEAQAAVSSLARTTAAAARGEASVKPLDAPVRRFSSVRVERVRPTAKSAARKPRKTAPKRKPGRPKGSGRKRSDAIAATVGDLKNREAQLLEWILEHGIDAVQRVIDRLNERIRKLT